MPPRRTFSWIFTLLISLSFGSTASENLFRTESQQLCDMACVRLSCPAKSSIRLIGADRIAEAVQCQGDESSQQSGTACPALNMTRVLQMIGDSCSRQQSCTLCPFVFTKDLCGSSLVPLLVRFKCQPDNFRRESIPPNSYIDLNCLSSPGYVLLLKSALLFRVVIQPSHVKQSSARGPCAPIDVTPSVASLCGLVSRCQVGPDSLSDLPSSDKEACGRGQLKIQYSCVSTLTIKEKYLKRTYHKETLMEKSRNQLNDQQTKSDLVENINTKNFTVVTEDVLVWIVSGVSVFLFFLISIGLGVWLYTRRGICGARRPSSLFKKIQNTNFVPPPASIDKIHIELDPDVVLLPSSGIGRSDSSAKDQSNQSESQEPTNSAPIPHRLLVRQLHQCRVDSDLLISSSLPHRQHHSHHQQRLPGPDLVTGRHNSPPSTTISASVSHSPTSTFQSDSTYPI